jgi:hypothetical protein
LTDDSAMSGVRRKLESCAAELDAREFAGVTDKGVTSKRLAHATSFKSIVVVFVMLLLVGWLARSSWVVSRENAQKVSE